MKTKIPPPAYRRIQEFLIKVYVSFYLFFLKKIYGFLLFSLERVILIKTPSLRFILALNYSLQMCLRTYMCRGSRPHPQMFLRGTSNLSHILRFCWPLQMPTSVTMESLSLCMSLILMSLDQFTIGHTPRNSTLPKSGLA